MGRLLSVNVGLPQDITWQGKTVQTGIWKTPVNGPRMVRRLNIDGEGQGDLNGHGGERRAVFVYQLDSYRYCQSHLGRNDFIYGQFGENFTVDGLSDAEVCIGDHYRIGGALFEVIPPIGWNARFASRCWQLAAVSGHKTTKELDRCTAAADQPTSAGAGIASEPTRR
jgi:MOSC domain-containing protein YiiM